MKLTDEQIEAAARAIYRSLPSSFIPWLVLSDSTREGYRSVARAAAPFLQMPWEPPIMSDMAAMYADTHQSGQSHSGEAWLYALRKFVERRNAALLPKQPFDPRREKIAAILSDPAILPPSVKMNDIADRILAALDRKDGQ